MFQTQLTDIAHDREVVLCIHFQNKSCVVNAKYVS